MSSSLFLAKHKGDAGSGKEEPDIATNVSIKMKKKEEIGDAELGKTIDRAVGIFATILGVVVAVAVIVPLVVFVATWWPLLLWLFFG